jgi:GT2 family glycosyltransferase
MIAPKKLGVVIVLFNSSDIIAECLERLYASHDAPLKIVLVDNNSTDNTCDVVRDWASGRSPFSNPENSPLGQGDGVVPKPLPLEEYQLAEGLNLTTKLSMIHSPVNGGFGYAVNCGLKSLLTDPEIDLFWVLNPDCVPHPEAASAYLKRANSGDFGLMTGLTVYYERPDKIQTFGGRVGRWTATCRQISSGLSPKTTSAPDANSVDFVTGANLLVTRQFIEKIGLMAEDYFLYYEEVDWAFRRKEFSILVAPEALVYHHGGTSIGSASVTRRASPFANYFNFRNRIRFAGRHLRASLPFVYLFAIAKAVQLLLKGAPSEAWAIFCGVFDLQPPREVSQRITDKSARELAFGRNH